MKKFEMKVMLDCLLVMAVMSVVHSNTSVGKKPNIIMILADDLGIGDIGCFGNDSIKTPHIDNLAKDGAKLTQFLTAAAMCTPSRAALLTGRYPVRSGMAGTWYHPAQLFIAESTGLPTEEITFAEIAQDAGYTTAIIGKWHLGLSKSTYRDFHYHPLHQGFDFFYGTPHTNNREWNELEMSGTLKVFPHFKYAAMGLLFSTFLFLFCCRRVGSIGPKRFVFFSLLACFVILLPTYICLNMKSVNSVLMRNYEVVEQPVRLQGLTRRLVQEAVEFIEDQAAKNQPFLLYFSLLQTHTALHAGKPFSGRSNHGKYGDEVEEMDWSVGEVLKALSTLGIDNNTFVAFSSDHGGHLEERGRAGNVEGGYNGIYRGGKPQGGVDGAIRVPTVVRWPGYIHPGLIIDEPLSNMDLFSTFVDLMEQRLPSDRIIDGRSLLPILTGQTNRSPHEFLIHYCEAKIHAIRWRPAQGSSVWKVRLATPRWEKDSDTCGDIFFCSCENVMWHRDRPLLFDMTNNPREDKPMDFSDPRYVDYVKTMAQAMKEHKNSLIPTTRSQNLFWIWDILWKPHLQPCCNFPYCTCTDSKYP